jgi:hypothetical protein
MEGILKASGFPEFAWLLANWIVLSMVEVVQLGIESHRCFIYQIKY